MKNQTTEEIIQPDSQTGQLNRLKQQQAIIAGLGQRALKTMDLQSLLDETVTLIAQALGVERVKFLELTPASQPKPKTKSLNLLDKSMVPLPANTAGPGWVCLSSSNSRP